jgi:Mor family transcriptional regulator
MASTVIGPKALHEESKDVLIQRLQYVPMFAQNMERGAGDLVGDLEQIIEHELWRVLDCNSMDEYAFRHLNGHTSIWCKEVIKVFNEEWKRKKELSVKETFARADRNEQIHKDREAGMTQQAIADKYELTQQQVSNVLQVKTVRTKKNL